MIYNYETPGVVEEITEMTGTPGSRKLTKYNTQGHLEEEILFKEDGTVDYKTVNKYDSRGNQIEKSAYLSEGELESKDPIQV